jgi:hypothetical protein
VPKVVRRHKGGHGWSALVRIGRRLLSERVREESGFVASEREK